MIAKHLGDLPLAGDITLFLGAPPKLARASRCALT
jgi:hypothetical protein